MPLYEYQCEACLHRFEVIQKFSDPAPQQCPQCGGAIHKLQSAPAFHLKGTGWYVTDYAKKDQGASAKSSDSKQEGKTTSESSDSSEKTDTSGKSEKSEKGDKGEKSEKQSDSSSSSTASGGASPGPTSAAPSKN